MKRITITITMLLVFASVAVAQTPMQTASEEAYLRAVATPAFTTNPTSGTVKQGASITLPAAALLDPFDNTPVYTWYKNGTTVAVGTGTALTLLNFQSGDAGTYVCGVTTHYFPTATWSNVATLAMGLYTSPQITGPTPSNARRYETDFAAFSVNVVIDPDDSNLTYQWYKGGTLTINQIASATLSTMTLNNLVTADSGSVYCAVRTQRFPADTWSNPATLTVYVKPTVTIIGVGVNWDDPTNYLVALLGGTAEYTAVVIPNGLDPMPQVTSFAWYFKGNPITLDASHVQADILDPLDPAYGTSTLTINPYTVLDDAPIPDPMVPDQGYRCVATYLPPALP